jgi:CRP/FNR family transcriptional regulator, cyclic AMP receptor protein
MADTPVDFRILAGAGSPAREFKAGEVIFKQGDDALELFIVQSGEVEIRLGSRLLETVSQYGIFGEMALIDSGPRSATAVAATDVKVVPIAEKQFLVPDQQHAAFRVERGTHHGAAITGDQCQLVGSR